MSVAALQIGSNGFQGVRRKRGLDIAADLRRQAKRLQAVQDPANRIPEGGDVGGSTVGAVASHVSANSLNVHNDTSSFTSPSYERSEGRTMSQVDVKAPSVTAEGLSARLAATLKAKYADARHAAKRVAMAAQVAPRTAKAWLQGEAAPRAAELIRLMAIDDDVYLAVMEMAGRNPMPSLSAEQRQAVAAALRILEGAE